MKITICLPAYKAEKTLEKTIFDLQPGLFDKIILVDDASPDQTVKIAKSLGLEVFVHLKRIGYGGNQKTCYDLALKRGAEIIVLLHPDYQYDPKMIGDLVQPIIDGKADFTFGSRFAAGGNPLKGGMPLYRYLGNRILTFIENLVLRTRFTELHSGFKAYSREFLESIPYHSYSNRFVFDSEMVIDAILKGFRISEVPIPTRYSTETSSAGIFDSLLYFFQTLYILFKKKYLKRLKQ